MKIFIPVILLTLIIGGCQTSSNNESEEAINAQLKVRANDLAHRFIIVDGHVDLPYRLNKHNFHSQSDKEEVIRTEAGDFDYERAKKGGLDAPFMSIYIPSAYQQTGGAKKLADRLINMVNSIAGAYPDKFAIATSPQEIIKNFNDGKIALPLGMENGAPIGNDLSNIAYFHKRGIRYITLTHAKDNQISDSSYDSAHTWNGLSPFGRKVIAEMNKVGIMVDVSHITDSAFYQVMEISKAPVIASHSSCRYFTPGFERNMSDEMIKLLGEKDGVIMINFGSTFIDQDSREAVEQVEKYLKAHNLDEDDDTAKDYINKYVQKNPYYSSVSKVADHIDHVVKIAGIDHVGLGSDFDGVGDTLPDGLKDVSQYPNLIYELLKRGYSDEDIEKICYKNLFRVWYAVEALAKNSQVEDHDVVNTD